MNNPPTILDGAKLIQWSPIDERHRPTGNCRHIVDGAVRGGFAGLAICRFDGEDAYYLFRCDESWSVVTDTWHQALGEAIEQAEFEFEGVSATWNVV